MEAFPAVLTRETFLQLSPDMQRLLHDNLNQLGVQSGVEQALTGPITSIEKFLASSPAQTLLLHYQDTLPVAYLKYSVRESLYFYDKQGKAVVLSPMCLLDFYVDKRLQRGGIGLQLFQQMLDLLQLRPEDIAYDRPSEKLTAFMKKHFHMGNGELQPNRYMIYDGFLSKKC